MKSSLKTISLESNKNKLYLIGFEKKHSEENKKNNAFTMTVNVPFFFSWLKMTTCGIMDFSPLKIKVYRNL